MHARHDATVILKDRLLALNMTVEEHLPRLCLTPQQKQVVWQRTWVKTNYSHVLAFTNAREVTLSIFTLVKHSTEAK